VLVRARDLDERDRLLRDGASSAVPVAAESSLQLGAETLRALRFAEDDVLRVLDAMRDRDYARLRAAQQGASGI
jgi:voltage-gated potassium channel Kch